MTNKVTTHPRTEHSFLSWQGNNKEWITWGGAHLLGVFIPVILLIFVMIFKKQIHNFFKDRMYLLRISGFIIIAFTILNRVLVAVSDYPLKWEYAPYHLCRLAVLLYGTFLMIGKYDWAKYIAFMSIMGAVFGLTMVNMNSIEVINKNGGVEEVFERSVGYDNYFWWDYFLAHGFGLVAPTIIWAARSWKMTYKQLLISFGIFFILGMVAWGLDWIFQDYGVNYFFMGKASSFKLDISILGDWKYRVPVYGSLAFFLYTSGWAIWKAQNDIDFTSKFKTKNA